MWSSYEISGEADAIELRLILHALRHREVEALAHSHTVILASWGSPNTPCVSLHFLISLAVEDVELIPANRQLGTRHVSPPSSGHQELALSSPPPLSSLFCTLLTHTCCPACSGPHMRTHKSLLNLNHCKFEFCYQCSD